MRDLLDIDARLRAAASGERFVLATLVSARGSSYRRLGACALIDADGAVTGVLSGGCVEGELVAHAREIASSTVVALDLSGDEESGGLGIGCGGAIDVLLEPFVAGRAGGDEDAFGPFAPIHRALSCRSAAARSAIAIELAGGRVGQRLVYTAQTGRQDDDAFADAFAPSPSSPLPRAPRGRLLRALQRVARGRTPVLLRDPHAVVIPCPTQKELIVFGAGPDAPPVVRLAHEIGFHVEVWDHRKARLLSPALALADVRRHVRVSALEAAAAALSCRVGAVVMNHHLAADRAALAGLFRASPAYLGVLGPRARTTRLVDDVARTLGKAPPPFASPVGLDLGGDGAHAIALSIVAEAHAVLHGREGGRLRARRGAIHADAA